MIPKFRIQEDVRQWLKEDIPFWDHSSQHLPRSEMQMARIFAKENGMISGVHVAKEVFETCGVEITFCIEDGTIVQEGDDILRLKGHLPDILKAERVALNILSHMSGITNKTHKLVTLVHTKSMNHNLRLACTRKTLPGLRLYQKYAVFVGGGDTHRMALSDMIMLKENHLRGNSTISEALYTAATKTSFSQKIEIEVETIEAAIEAVETGIPEIIMLDNFPPDMIPEAVKKIKGINASVLVEASGNITEDNIIEYAGTGIDIISMGSLTHSVKGFDLSLRILN